MKKVEVTEEEVLEFKNLEAVTVGAGQFFKLAVSVWRTLFLGYDVSRPELKYC